MIGIRQGRGGAQDKEAGLECLKRSISSFSIFILLFYVSFSSFSSKRLTVRLYALHKHTAGIANVVVVFVYAYFDITLGYLKIR